MKRYKIIDAGLQTALILFCITAALVNNIDSINPLSILLLLGAVQVVSLLVHLLAGPQPWKKKLLRKIHAVGILAVFIMLFIAFLQDGSGRSSDKDDKYIMYGLETMVYAAGLAILMIIYYAIICWIEWRDISKE